MKKKIVALILCLTVVFTMTVPVSASDLPKADKVAYMALGDSVAAGCKNLDFMFNTGANIKGDDPAFTAFTYNTNEYVTEGSKDTNIYAVPFSYVYKLAKRFNADEATSFNGTYVGLRSKDVCHILGIDPLEGDSYDSKGDLWGNAYMDIFTADWDKVPDNMKKSIWQHPYEYRQYSNWGKLFTAESKTAYDKAIRTSDIITIELGENDITAFYENNSKEILNAFIASAKPLNGAETLIKDFTKHFYKLNISKTTEEKSTALRNLLKDFNQFIKLGGDMTEILRSILDIMERMTTESRYYFKALMDYINENKLPDATVIVSTVMNPLSDADIEAGEAFLGDSAKFLTKNGIELETMVEMMNLVIAPYVQGMNLYIKKLATTTTYKDGKKTIKRNYYVADLSGVSLNPGEIDGVQYLLHPDAKGQKTIADRFYYAKPVTDATVAAAKMTKKVIKKAITERKKRIS